MAAHGDIQRLCCRGIKVCEFLELRLKSECREGDDKVGRKVDVEREAARAQAP